MHAIVKHGTNAFLAIAPSRVWFTDWFQWYLYHVFYRYWCPGGNGPVRDCVRGGHCGCSNAEAVSMTNKTPREIIANVPGLPGGELRDVPKGTQIIIGFMAADDILHALGRAGYFICRMPGGVHEGYCPTCGCEPYRGDGESQDEGQRK